MRSRMCSTLEESAPNSGFKPEQHRKGRVNDEKKLV